MKAVLADAAEAELADAAAYYRAQSAALGDDFLTEFLAAVTRIEEFPEAWQLMGESVRRCRLHRFPYGLIYRVQGDVAVIAAVAHLHREPEHWRGRLGNA